MSDERRVRTMAGWIGVEISRSRVRTPRKAGYGLYRVRGQRELPGGWVMCEWTPYTMGLGAIESAVGASIRNGAPSGPGSLIAGGCVVPTRWTSAYTGRRDQGVVTAEQAERMVMPVALRPEFAAEMNALVALLDAGLMEMTHDEDCICEEGKFTASCVRATMTPVQRQRVENGAFHAEHLARREHGLKARYAAKTARNTVTGHPAGDGPEGTSGVQ